MMPNTFLKASLGMAFFFLTFCTPTTAGIIIISDIQYASDPGANDGRLCIYLEGSPEVAPFDIFWSNGVEQTTDGSGEELCIENLAPGEYWVTIRNFYGCEETIFQTIGLCEDIGITPVNIVPTCEGSPSGSIEVEIAGGFPPYSFYWENEAGVQLPGEALLENIDEGTYCLTVIDQFGCTGYACFSTGTFPPPDAVPTVDFHEQCICTPGQSGQIDISLTGGQGPFTFHWTGPYGFEANTQNIHDLYLTGPYHLEILNENNCPVFGETRYLGLCETILPYIQKLEVVVYAEQPVQIYHGEWVNNGDCILFAGGSMPFDPEILIDNTIRFTATANEPLAFLNIEVIGFETPSVPGVPFLDEKAWLFSFPPGSISWEQLQELLANSQSPSLPIKFTGEDKSGNQLLDLVTMSNNMTSCVPLPELQENCSWQGFSYVTGSDLVHEIEIGCINLFDISYDITPPSGWNSADGAIQVAVNAPPLYKFNWVSGEGVNPGNMGSLYLDGVSVGTYCFIVKENQYGCAKKVCLNVFGLEQGYQSACPGNTNGIFCASPMGGIGPFQYSWSPPGLLTDELCAFNLENGQNISVSVKDLGTGLTGEVNFTLPEYSPPVIELSSFSPACDGQADGSICIEASGGYPPYSFLWDDGSTGSCFTQAESNLQYCVTVIDFCGETVANCLTLPDLYDPPVILSVTTTDALKHCQNGTGKATVIFDNGMAPFSFSWEGPQGVETTSAPTIGGLKKGIYNVTITDACGNNAQTTFEIKEKPNPYWFSLEGEIENACEVSSNSGAIDLTVEWPLNQSSSLTYHWNTGQGTSDLHNIPPGDYSVTVTSVSGCINTWSGTVLDGAPIPIEEITNTIEGACTGSTAGSINLEMPGGNEGYAFSWNSGQSEHFIDNLAPGIYEVTISDGICEALSVYEVVAYPSESAILPNYIVGSSGDNGAINIGVEGEAPFTFNWSNGATTEDIQGLAPGNYTVTVFNSFGCAVSSAFIVPQLQESNAGIFLECIEGGVSIHAGGETPGTCYPFSYYWSAPDGSPGTGAFIPSNGISGPKVYCVTVTDGCNGVTDECIEIDCECFSCQNCWWAEFEQVSPCLESNSKIKFQKKIWSSVSYPAGPDPFKEDITVVWWDGEISTYGFGGIFFGYYSYNNISGPDSKSVNAPEIYTVKVILSNGCSYTESFSFDYGPLEVISGFQTAPLSSLVGDPALPEISTAFGAWKCLNCGPLIYNSPEDCEEGLEYGDFTYTPEDQCNPCFGGGTLSINYPGEQPAFYPVQNNNIATEFFEGDPGTEAVPCKCYFPASLVQGIDLPVYVEVEGGKDCTGGSTTDPPDPVVIGCEGELIFIEEEVPCFYTVICISPEGIQTLEHVMTAELICFKEDETCIWICGISGEPIINPPIPLPIISDEDCDDTIDGGWSCDDRRPDAKVVLNTNWGGHEKQKFNGSFKNLTTKNALLREKPEVLIIDAFPNPFKEGVTLHFELTAPSDLTVRLVNVLGAVIFEKDLGEFSEGSHQYPIFDLKNLAPGIYRVSLSGKNTTSDWVGLVKMN